MGTLVHGYGAEGYSIEDRKLSHIELLVALKLSRGESFYLSWQRPPREGSGRVSVWVSTATPLQFRFTTGHHSEINREWLEHMMRCSFGPRGLVVVDEDDPIIGTPVAPSLI